MEAVASQKKEDLILACEHTLQYSEGVPQVIVPDNLRAAVTKSSKYESMINDDFADFADHYGCSIIPTRAYRPRDKALVEGAVKLIYRSIYLRLKGRTFYDLASLNLAIRVALEVHTNAPFSGRSYSRRDQFEEIERMTLGKLNPITYEIKKQSIVTVMKNGHIHLSEDAYSYSVPCKYIGKKVKLLYTSSLIEIYYRYEKIAEHTRFYSRFRYTTDQQHLASHHRAYSKWNAEKFIAEATTRMNLLDVIEDRYGKKSTIITSQIPVNEWHDWVGDKTVADAVLDRIVHRSLWVELYGESLRKLKL